MTGHKIALITDSTCDLPEHKLREYGIGMALTGLVVAYVFWRMRPDESLSPSKVSTASASQ